MFFPLKPATKIQQFHVLDSLIIPLIIHGRTCVEPSSCHGFFVCRLRCSGDVSFSFGNSMFMLPR